MSDTAVETPNVMVMNQLPSSEIVGESPLHHADLASAAATKNEGGVHLRENALQGFLTLRLNPENKDLLASANAVLGLELPTKPLSSVTEGATTARWMSPDEWLISVPGEAAFDLETAFQEKVDGHFSLVNSSGGVTTLVVSGEHVVEMLKKSVPYDFHISEFPAGKVVSTLFAKSSAVIRRLDEQAFELIIRRSFADYIWLWIQDASREYGLVIKND
ncbi:sarcosine oxidase subunit gamma [Marinomonas balearica]|uniref:Sarcosine oxidase subunit gamma n=1 Tax=Marinomonas balearica TaxID=491947 RepID=A0A4R6MDK7_9GAMM|nr:sarcosine oxidase subunit gamma family protein [Marinomonas balearica]TDO99807.1 sarcosine oxidase subunit gamma [Marinomonas balearica]